MAGVPLFMVLAAVVYIAIGFAQGEREQQHWVVHTYQVMDSLRAIAGDVADAETGQRGFLLTRNRSFLEPYDNARPRIADDLARFERLTGDNPVQQLRARSLRALIASQLDLLAQTLRENSQAETGPAMIADLGRDKDAMDRLRVTVGQGLADEQRLLAERVRTRRAVERAEILAAVLAMTLALAVLATAAGMLVRNNMRLAVSEAARRRQASILQATLDNIREGIVVFDEKGRVAAFNDIFFRLMDFPPGLAAVGTAIDHFRNRDAESARVGISDLVESPAGEDIRYERLVRGGRELDVYRAAVPGAGFLVAAADVTARERAEATMRQAQKMESIGQLTGGVAHDFNNLLQIISANLELAAGQARSDVKLVERLQVVISAVERGSRLTSQLLAFARRQTLDPRSTNLGGLLRDMTELLHRTLGEHVEVEAIVAGGLWNSLVDRGQVENAILNLAINGRDAMPEGGKLTVELSNAYLDDSYASQHADVTPGQYVLLAVTDTGRGMPPDVVSRVFDPFFTTKPEGKGTGLGLSQVYGFVKQSGGHVKIYSEPGHGTTVKVYLPRTSKPQEDVEPESVVDAPGGFESILVVEDNAAVRAAAVDVLAELGYAVLKADHAEQALAVLHSGARVDLLFTDVVMPGPISTRELVRRAQNLRPGLRVLYTSGYTQNAIVHNGTLDAGANLLSKPYRKNDLARRLRSVLEGAPPTPENPQAVGIGAGPAASRRSKVLLVEDDALIRMTTAEMLQEIGLEVVEAGNAPDALSILMVDSLVNILITDLNLPGMDGRRLTAEALRLRPGLKVIFATGYGPSLGGDGEMRGVAVLAKPFDLAALRVALQSA